MSRQRKRHLARMPLEETVLLATSELAASSGSVHVEVHDHDNIQGLVVVIELAPSTSAVEVQQLREKVRSYLNQLVASDPSNRCLASWSASFERKGTVVASASVFDRPSADAA